MQQALLLHPPLRPLPQHLLLRLLSPLRHRRRPPSFVPRNSLCSGLCFYAGLWHVLWGCLFLDGLAVHRGACGFTGHHGFVVRDPAQENGVWRSISLPPDSLHAFPPDSLVPSPSPRPPTSPPSLFPSNPPLDSKPPVHHPAPWPSPASTSSQNVPQSFNSKHHTISLWSGVTVGSLFIFISALGIFYFRSNKVITVKPWATGLSGQLQKAFVTGVPKLQRSELEAACEDFSNIIGSISDGIVYKGCDFSLNKRVCVPDYALDESGSGPCTWLGYLGTGIPGKRSTVRAARPGLAG
ncbi:unnamed protein product [Camellia sinensis]